MTEVKISDHRTKRDIRNGIRHDLAVYVNDAGEEVSVEVIDDDVAIGDNTHSGLYTIATAAQTLKQMNAPAEIISWLRTRTDDTSSG